MPLPMHAWAKQAAILATCAGEQGDSAFWRAHDFFFTNQKSIRPDTVESAFFDSMKQEAGIDVNAIKACVVKGGADRVIARDFALAQLLHVRATPTLFINGERAPGIRSAGARDADQVAPKVDAAFRKYPNYRDNVAEERQLKAEIYKLVLPVIGKDAMVATVKRMMELQRS
jgi:protein-disulfide isomerase